MSKLKIKYPEKRLLSDTAAICLTNKVKMSLLPQKTHRRASGWVYESEFMCCFDPSEKSYETNWGVFVHESCHVDQMLDEKSIWHHKELDTDKDWLDLHTRGKTRKSKKIERYFKKLLELELDCEERAIEKIKKYKLNIDVDEYIQRGNVYLFSYYSFYHLKCWYDKKFRIYDQKDIVESMPKKYLSAKQYWKKNELIYEMLKKHNNR